MFHLLLRLLFLGAAVVFALLAFIHVFPFLLILLAAFGVFKLYQALRGPKYPPDRWR